MRLLALLTLLSCVSCTTKNPEFCDEETPCADDSTPFCDLAGEYGPANTCIPVPPMPDATPSIDAGAPCEPAGTFLRCDGDTRVVCSENGTEQMEVCDFGCVESDGRCNECEPSSTSCTFDELTVCDADGVVESVSTCPLGCHSTEARCNKLDPSNELASYLDLAGDADDISLTDGATFNTDTGTVTNGDSSTILISSFFIAAPPDGRDIRVFVVHSLSLGNTTFEGRPAAAVVSDRDIVISGTIGFGNLVPGAFTVAPCVGSDGDTTTIGSATNASGGGGGGSREAGARGGDVELAVTGGAGGMAFPNPDLVPLRGGCSGGGQAGGRGGGGLQLVSGTRIQLSASAIINAGGKGGGSEDAGGGSGGGILLEAPAVSLASMAVLAANGGGGSCPQQPGQDGRSSTVAAAGGSCPDAAYSDGGNGGTGTMNPEPGADLTASSTVDLVSGSGGGSAGYVRINTRDGVFDTASDAIVSPGAATGTLGVR